MPVFIKFKSWSGKDAAKATQQLSKVFKLKAKQTETVMEMLATGRAWKYGVPVGDVKAGQAKAFFQKLGFEIELIADEKPAAAGVIAQVAPSPATPPSNTITEKDFEVPGVVWVTDESPELIEKKDDRRLLEIKRTPVFVVIVLSLLTLGLYNVFWFLSRMPALNNLDSKNKLSPGMLQTMFVLSGTLAVFDVLELFFDIHLGVDIPIIIVSIVVVVLYIFVAFRTRRILLDHLDANMTGLKTISGALTLFLGNIFLQYKINGIHDWYAKGEEGELQLRGDGTAWTWFFLFYLVFPIVVMVYFTMSFFDEFDPGDEVTGGLMAGYQLGSYYAACDSFWQEQGDDQICTTEVAADSELPYVENPKVTVTGSGTRETFYAEAVFSGSDSVYAINGQGDVELKEGDESFIINFDEKSGS